MEKDYKAQDEIIKDIYVANMRRGNPLLYLTPTSVRDTNVDEDETVDGKVAEIFHSVDNNTNHTGDRSPIMDEAETKEEMIWSEKSSGTADPPQHHASTPPRSTEGGVGELMEDFAATTSRPRSLTSMDELDGEGIITDETGTADDDEEERLFEETFGQGSTRSKDQRKRKFQDNKRQITRKRRHK